jgi:hypothetical protein
MSIKFLVYALSAERYFIVTFYIVLICLDNIVVS